MSAAAVELRRVSKTFGTVRAVDDLSMTIASGRLTTLLGPSGCGKTTTLRLIAGLDFPTAGEIFVGDREVSMRTPGERNVAMVSPAAALVAHMTAIETVCDGLRASPRSRAEIAERARAALARVGLAGFEDRLPSELSSGQRQRVIVARTLVQEPAVLLFDEPLSNVDAGLRRRVRGEIRALQQALGITVVYVTHDHGEAMAISDHVVVMRAGAIAQAGTPHALYEAPASEFVARFMGEANRVSGRLESRDGDLGVVDLGGVRVRLPHRDQPLGPVVVAIRPEAIALTAKGTGAIDGTVRDAAYLGTVVEYTIATALGDLFVVDRDAATPFEPGEIVGLAPRERGIVIIPAAAR